MKKIIFYTLLACISFAACKHPKQNSKSELSASTETVSDQFGTVTVPSGHRVVGVSIDRIFGGSEDRPVIFIVTEDTTAKTVIVYQTHQNENGGMASLEEYETRVAIPKNSEFLSFSIDRVYGEDKAVVFVTFRNNQSKLATLYKVGRSGTFEKQLDVR